MTKSQDIKIGDEIYGLEGKAVAVVDILSGNEEYIITIDKGRTIKLTKRHPIKTDAGIITMRDLMPGMNVVLEDRYK